MVKNCNSWKLKSLKPYIDEFTVFIRVKIDNVNEFSNEIPEKVKKITKTNKDMMKITTDKKYFFTSVFSKLMSWKKCLLIKTFLGLTCDIKSFIENLNKAYNFINLIPELVEKKRTSNNY